MSPQIEQGDIEQELRELFREKVGEAPIGMPDGVAAPQQVLRRGRRRQVGTVLGSAALAAALVVGTVAGLQSILRTDGEKLQTSPPGYDVFERVASVEAFTLSSPSDWFLVNEWPLSVLMPVGASEETFSCEGAPVGEPAEDCETTGASASLIPQPSGIPMLQLSNLDLGLDYIACRDGLPTDAAVLYIAVDLGGALAPDGSSLGPYPIGPGLPDPTENGPCGPGTYAHFTVNGTPMFFWIGVGDGVTDADRATVRRTAEMMYADDGWKPSQPDHVTPAYVMAGGFEESGDDWRLELRPSETNVELTLIGATPGQTLFGDTVPEVPIAFCCASTDGLSDATLLNVTFGFVDRDATGVELIVREGDELTGQALGGTLVPVPPSLGEFDFDLFFIEGTGGLSGNVVPLGIDSDPISPSPSAESRGGVVSLSGAYEDTTWIVEFTGSFAEQTACIEVIEDGESFGLTCPTPQNTSLAGEYPSLHGWHTSFYLLAGSVPDHVTNMRFVSDDGTDPLEELQCSSGPIGWVGPDKKVCVLTFPPNGSGTLQYLHADGTVLFEDGMAWGGASPSPIPSPVEPIHGGTYWAVYPWLGAEGGPESNAVVGQLFDDFGIQASQGELNCDDGAREMLDTDAQWAVAVYFATEQEANDFALQAGLLDHTRRVIAEVTTYCLD